MKTLDEVLKAMEYCKNHNWCDECPYQYEDICYGEDSIHYLNELRHILDNTVWVESTKEENGYWKLPTLPETGNDPLTWDELKKMEGKPVWVDAKSLSIGSFPFWRDWYIIKSFSNDEFMYCNDGFEWAKETQGRLWQAYSKEKK